MQGLIMQNDIHMNTVLKVLTERHSNLANETARTFLRKYQFKMTVKCCLQNNRNKNSWILAVDSAQLGD